MSRRTIILIIVLIAATGVLLAMALNPQQQYRPAPQLRPIQKPNYVQTILELSNNPTVVASSASALPSYSIDVSMKTYNNNVTAVQLELSFDPNVLINVDIKPGSFLKNPIVLVKKIDILNGRISYALGIPPGGNTTVGSGTVAVITFMSKELPGQTTTINILPQSLVTAQGVDKSVLKSGLGKTFTLGTPPSSSTSPVQNSSGTPPAY